MLCACPRARGSADALLHGASAPLARVVHCSASAAAAVGAGPPAWGQSASTHCPRCPHWTDLPPAPSPPFPMQAVQYVAEHGEVCPAGWKPGEKTMVADPEKSLEYFESVGGEEGVRPAAASPAGPAPASRAPCLLLRGVLAGTAEAAARAFSRALRQWERTGCWAALPRLCGNAAGFPSRVLPIGAGCWCRRRRRRPG